MDVGSNLSWQSTERKGSVHCRARPGMQMYGAVYMGRWGNVHWRCKIFLICFKN